MCLQNLNIPQGTCNLKSYTIFTISSLKIANLILHFGDLEERHLLTSQFFPKVCWKKFNKNYINKTSLTGENIMILPFELCDEF